MFETSTIASGLQSELARLRVDGRGRSVSELVDLVGDCQSVINRATALQTLAMAHVAAIEDVALEDGTVVEQHRGLGHQRLDAPALVSDQLGVSDAAAGSRVAAALAVVTRTPAVFEAMGAGLLDGYRARIVTEELAEAPAEVCDQVVARIADSLGTEPPAGLRRRVRRVLAAVDADLVRAKAARTRSERSLCRWPGDEPGVDTWMGSFPVEQSRSGWAVVDGLARQYVREGKVTGLEQARADALMDLIHARATGTFVVQLAVPADQLATLAPQVATPTRSDTEAGPSEAPIAPLVRAEVDEVMTVSGLGMPGTTQVRRAWVEALTGSDTGTGLDSGNCTATATSTGTGTGTTTDRGQGARREAVSCHADTGALLAAGVVPDAPGQSGGPGRPRRALATESKAYRPPPALVDLVKARDGCCRFPGCSVNSRFCDLDHVIAWPAGPTHATNLICLCRRHHRIKQTLRWGVRIDPDATVTWTDPTARRRVTLPVDFLQRDARSNTSDAGEPQTPGASTQHSRQETIGQAPVDGPGVLWSAWEEELTHALASAERDVRRAAGSCRRERRALDVEIADGAVGRPDFTTGLEMFTLDPPRRRGSSRGHRGRAGLNTRAGEPPPF